MFLHPLSFAVCQELQGISKPMSAETKTSSLDLSREYSLEEYRLLEDEAGYRYELVEGKLIMSPAPSNEHAWISDKLLLELKLFLGANPAIGEVWSHAGFYLGKKPNGKDNVLEPDLGFLVAGRVPANSDLYLPYPDLAIEVWSRSSDLDGPARLKKAREKLQIYLAAGTSIAWGINPVAQEVEIYRREQPQVRQVLSVKAELEGEALIPGFKIALARLFR